MVSVDPVQYSASWSSDTSFFGVIQAGLLIIPVHGWVPPAAWDNIRGPNENELRAKGDQWTIKYPIDAFDGFPSLDSVKSVTINGTDKEVFSVRADTEDSTRFLREKIGQFRKSLPKVWPCTWDLSGLDPNESYALVRNGKLVKKDKKLPWEERYRPRTLKYEKIYLVEVTPAVQFGLIPVDAVKQIADPRSLRIFKGTSCSQFIERNVAFEDGVPVLDMPSADDLALNSP